MSPIVASKRDKYIYLGYIKTLHQPRILHFLIASPNDVEVFDNLKWGFYDDEEIKIKLPVLHRFLTSINHFCDFLKGPKRGKYPPLYKALHQQNVFFPEKGPAENLESFKTWWSSKVHKTAMPKLTLEFDAWDNKEFNEKILRNQNKNVLSQLWYDRKPLKAISSRKCDALKTWCKITDSSSKYNYHQKVNYAKTPSPKKSSTKRKSSSKRKSFSSSLSQKYHPLTKAELSEQKGLVRQSDRLRKMKKRVPLNHLGIFYTFAYNFYICLYFLHLPTQNMKESLIKFFN